MSENNSEHSSSVVDSAVNSVAEKVSELPVSTPADGHAEEPLPGRFRLFNRLRPLHETLGSGNVADVILWRRRNVSIGILVVATAVWYLFEWSGYTLLSLVATVLLLLVSILFVWSNAAAVLNRPPPPLPELEVSEDTIHNTSAIVRTRINHGLKVARELALGKDYKLFCKVAFGLWILSTVGSWFDMLTLAYLSLWVLLTIPVLYDKYEDHLDKHAEFAYRELKNQYQKFDINVLSKIPRGLSKAKKIQ